MRAQNLLICADNASALQDLADDSMDLCYIDPPFFSNQRYDLLWGKGHESRGFADTFGNNLTTYLAWMETRIRLIYQKLKPTGSFYLHCDWHASHYLKVLCDSVFGYDHFLNEIVWSYQGTGESQRYFKRKHDILLFYAKTKTYFFSPQHTSEPISDFSRTKYTKTDAHGRFKLIKHPDGTLHKQYARTHQRMRDVWEFPVLNANATERVGYKTQKPEALLRRIIQASAPPDGWVLDCFAGSGTTASVCAQLHRHFITIDANPVAIRVAAQRLRQVNAPYQVVGLPNTWLQWKNLSPLDLTQWIAKCMGWVLNVSSTTASTALSNPITAWANRTQVPVHIATTHAPIAAQTIEAFVDHIADYPYAIYVAWAFSEPAHIYVRKLNGKIGALTYSELCADLCADSMHAAPTPVPTMATPHPPSDQ